MLPALAACALAPAAAAEASGNVEFWRMYMPPTPQAAAESPGGRPRPPSGGLAQAPPPPPGAEGGADCDEWRLGARVGGETKELPPLLATFGMCQDEAELRTLRVCQLEEVRASMPPSYRPMAILHVRASFDARLAELRGEAPAGGAPDDLPVLLLGAEQCPNEAELRAWRVHQLERGQQVLPPEDLPIAAAAIRDVFDRRLPEVREREGAHRRENLGERLFEQVREESGAPLGAQPGEAASEQATAAGGEVRLTAPPAPPASSGLTLLAVAAGLATPALMALAGGAITARLRFVPFVAASKADEAQAGVRLLDIGAREAA